MSELQWCLLHAPEYNCDSCVVLPALQGPVSGGNETLAEDPVAFDFVLSIRDPDKVPWEDPCTTIASWSPRAWVHLHSRLLFQEGLSLPHVTMSVEVACSTFPPWKHPPRSCSSKCSFRRWGYLSQDNWIKSWQPAIKKHLPPVFTSLFYRQRPCIVRNSTNWNVTSGQVHWEDLWNYIFFWHDIYVMIEFISLQAYCCLEFPWQKNNNNKEL